MTNATTADQPNDRNSADEFADAVAGAARQAWWATLGLVAVAGEQAGKLINALVDKGKEVEPSVSDAFKKAGDQLSHAAGKVGARVRSAMDRGAGAAESAVDERVAAALHRMGFPTKEDVQAIAERIDALAARLEEMARQRSEQG